MGKTIFCKQDVDNFSIKFIINLKMEDQRNYIPCLRGRNGPLHGVDFWIEKEEFFIGRQPESDLVLNDGTISAIHAKIVKQEDRYHLIDLNSTNGTSINQEKIKNKQLRTDDIVAFDKLEFQFIYRKDVSRTVKTDPFATPSAEATEIHSPPIKMESISKRESFQTDHSHRRILKGNIFALLVSVIIISGASFLANLFIAPGNSLNGFGRILGSSLTEIPLLLLPAYWIHFLSLDLTSIKFLAVPVSFFLSGFILQRFNQKSRFRNTIYFTFAFIGIALILQVAIQNFNMATMTSLYSNFGYGFSSNSITFIVHFLSMIVIIFLPTYIGSFCVKSISFDSILQKKL